MNTSEKYSLSWKDFQSNVSQSFRTLKEEKDFFDVTLVSEDLQQIEAHKVVLSSSSPVFKQLLRSNKHSHPMLYIRGAKHTELEHILDFIYSGEVSIYQENLNGFLGLAEDLKLKGLSNAKDDHELEEKPKLFSRFNDSLTHPMARESFDDILTPLEEVSTMFEDLDGGNEDFSLVQNTNEDSNDDYETTINSMIEKVNNMWCCKVCSKQFIAKRKDNLKEHVETKHTSGFIHACSCCAKSCHSKTALRMHKSKHH